VGSEQSARHVLGLIQEIPAAHAVVSDRKLAAHPLDDAVQIAASSKMRQERSVLIALRFPIDAVHVGRVEVVAVDSPRFVEYLRPLGAGVDANLDVVDVELAGSRLRLGRYGDNRPGVVAGVENLLLVGGNLV